jgi:hypothetical protein
MLREFGTFPRPLPASFAPQIFADRTGTAGVMFPHRRIPPGRMPNQILTFRPCPRKLPQTQKQTAQTK